MKGVVNDYKNALNLLSKLNKLLEIQHIFCERYSLTDIFDTICSTVCQTLVCDRCTLYLVDNIRKELWSKSAKDSKTIIRLPIGKGLAGFVAENKTNLVLDDAYFDPRFNKEYDLRTGYRTKSVLCIPIFDNQTREVVGVIQALNKKVKPYIFDTNDEITSVLLAKMVGSLVKESMKYSDYTIHEHKITKLINISPDIVSSQTVYILIDKTKDLITKLFSTDKVNMIIKIKSNIDNNKYEFLKINEDSTQTTLEKINQEKLKLGLTGKAFTNKTYNFVHSTYNSEEYNPTIDIDTTLPVITLPILNTNTDEILGIMQLEYNISKLGMNDFRITNVDQMDLDILSLLSKIFALSLLKFE